MPTSGTVCHDVAAPGPRRRSSRLNLTIPLEVRWSQKREGTVTEPARTRDMSPHGAFLLMKNCPPLHAAVTLENLMSGETVEGRVTHLRRSKDGKLLGAPERVACAALPGHTNRTAGGCFHRFGR